MIGFLLILSPILSALFNGTLVLLLESGGWRHFAKYLFSVCLVLLAYPSGRPLRGVYMTIYAAFAVLSVTILFRYFVLHQIDFESGRMKLPGRHGDPNFSCLYMTIGMVFSLGYLSPAKKISGYLINAACLILF